MASIAPRRASSKESLVFEAKSSPPAAETRKATSMTVRVDDNYILENKHLLFYTKIKKEKEKAYENRNRFRLYYPAINVKIINTGNVMAF